MKILAIGFAAGPAMAGAAHAEGAPVGVWCLGGSAWKAGSRATRPTEGFVSLGFSRVF